VCQLSELNLVIGAQTLGRAPSLMSARRTNADGNTQTFRPQGPDAGPLAEERSRSLELSLGVGGAIFEGTEQIQQLVISRAISGLRIE
jgi:hypothetical protein